MSDTEPCAYVGVAPCGCVVGVTVDIPGGERFTGQMVAGFIRDGLAVSRVPVGDGITLSRCPHKTIKPEQEVLAL